MISLFRDSGLLAKTSASVGTSLVILLAIAVRADALDLGQGFTEPYRTIEVAVHEAGVIEKVLVKEGQRVAAGTAIALLDEEIAAILLKNAKARADMRGRLIESRAERDLREERLRNLEMLLARGSANENEIATARKEAIVADARVMAAEEELAIAQLDYLKAKTLVQRRTIRAPVDGVVLSIDKHRGEYVAPNAVDFIKIVQLDPLCARLNVAAIDADKLANLKDVKVAIAGIRDPIDGTIEMISPITEPGSQTVQVKIRIGNPDGRFQSGRRCSLVLPD